MNYQLKLGRYVVAITHPDRILFPDDRITKADLIEYYMNIAPLMLGYMKDRPLTMHRFPEGITHDSFYQKDVPDYFPNWIDRVKVKKKEGGFLYHLVCNKKATLIYLANQACITPHLWLSKTQTINFPDRMIFDLDPYDDQFLAVRIAAQQIKSLLEDIGLTSFVMTTGSHGVHVVVPLVPKHNFDLVRRFARDVCMVLERRDPKKLTTEIRKEKRKRRLFLDVMRNSYAATAVSPYAVRAIPGAPVATPLSWQELDDRHITARTYTIRTIARRIEQRENPWKSINRCKQSLVLPRTRLDKLLSE